MRRAEAKATGAATRGGCQCGHAALLKVASKTSWYGLAWPVEGPAPAGLPQQGLDVRDLFHGLDVGQL
eukprot:4605519-Pyramimonas_sp.AAC.1